MNGLMAGNQDKTGRGTATGARVDLPGSAGTAGTVPGMGMGAGKAGAPGCMPGGKPG